MPQKRPATNRLDDSRASRLANNRLAKLFRGGRNDSQSASGTLALMDRLETRQFLTTVTVEQYGATADNGGDDQPAIQAALLVSAPGDTVVVGSGVYNLARSITVPTGVILQGTDGNKLKFSGIAAGQFAVIIGANGDGTTLTGLNIDGGAISMNVGSRYRNIRITNNDITGVAGSSYAAISCHKSNEGVTIENNTFHDFKGWGFEYWYMNNGSISRNLFKNITQAAHIMSARNNVQVNGNQGIQLSRMGIEWQQRDSNTELGYGNYSVKGNAFYNWKLPYWDSFGLSIMPQSASNVRIEDNYLAATFFDGRPAFKEPDSGGTYRFGMPIEAGYYSGIVQNNTIAGDWDIWGPVAAMYNMKASGNKFYYTDRNMNPINHPRFGEARYNYMYSHENGLDYYSPRDGVRRSGSWSLDGTDTTLTSFPTPPTSFPGADGSIPDGGDSGGDPISDLTAPTLSGVALDSTSISLNWTDPNDNETGYQVERAPDAKTWTTIKILGAGVTRYVDTKLTPGTVYYYRVKAIGESGLSPASNVGKWRTKIVVNSQTAAASTTPSPGNLVGGKLFSDDLISL